MRSFKINRGGATVLERIFPARDADAPFVARLESGKSPLWNRRDKIVSIEHGEIQKFLGDFHADGMLTEIFRAGATKTITIETGDRIMAAAFKFGSQDVRRHALYSKLIEGCCFVGEQLTMLNR